MKKTVLILCTLFFSMLIAAQKVKVEDSFEQLFFHAEKKFKSVMGVEISRTTEKEETNVQIKSKLELQPSVSNTVSMTYKGKDTTLYFNSTLSTHKTMAEAVANHIYKLRKRQLKLAGYEYEHHPNDAATLKLTLDQLKKEEIEFTQLFIGKQTSKHHSLCTTQNRF